MLSEFCTFWVYYVFVPLRACCWFCLYTFLYFWCLASLTTMWYTATQVDGGVDLFSILLLMKTSLLIGSLLKMAIIFVFLPKVTSDSEVIICKLFSACCNSSTILAIITRLSANQLKFLLVCTLHYSLLSRILYHSCTLYRKEKRGHILVSLLFWLTLVQVNRISFVDVMLLMSNIIKEGT